MRPTKALVSRVSVASSSPAVNGVASSHGQPALAQFTAKWMRGSWKRARMMSFSSAFRVMRVPITSCSMASKKPGTLITLSMGKRASTAFTVRML